MPIQEVGGGGIVSARRVYVLEMGSTGKCTCIVHEGHPSAKEKSPDYVILAIFMCEVITDKKKYVKCPSII